MVIKGNARGSAGFLAAHLTRLDTNDRAEVLELRGMASPELRDGLREMEAIGLNLTGTKRPLYHASISPDPGEVMTAEQRDIAIKRLETALGFTDQPRAVVFEQRPVLRGLEDRAVVDHRRGMRNGQRRRRLRHVDLGGSVQRLATGQ